MYVPNDMSADCFVYSMNFTSVHLVVFVLAVSFSLFFPDPISVHWIVLCICAFICILIYVYTLCSLEHMSCLCLLPAWSDVHKKALPSGKWSMVNKVLFKQKDAKCKHKSALVSCVGHIWHQCIPNPSVSPQLLSRLEKKKKKKKQSKWVENKCHQWLHAVDYSGISRWDSDNIRETVC